MAMTTTMMTHSGEHACTVRLDSCAIGRRTPSPSTPPNPPTKLWLTRDNHPGTAHRRSDQNVASVSIEHDLEVCPVLIARCAAESKVFRGGKGWGWHFQFGGREVAGEGRADALPCRAAQGNGSWEHRGKLTYTGPKHVNSKSKRLVSVHVEQAEFTAAQVAKVQKLIDGGVPYRIRVQSDVADPSSAKVMASIPSCLLAAAKFHEILRVHVDQHGHIRGMWYQTLATGCPPAGAIRLPEESTKLVTSVSVDMESKGPKLAVDVKPKSPEEEIKDNVQSVGYQSFLQKYWMYLLGGVVLLSLVGGEDDPKKGGGGKK